MPLLVYTAACAIVMVLFELFRAIQLHDASFVSYIDVSDTVWVVSFLAFSVYVFMKKPSRKRIYAKPSAW